MIDLSECPSHILIAEKDEHVLVRGVEFVLSYDSVLGTNRIYLTAADSDFEGYEKELAAQTDKLMASDEENKDFILRMIPECIYPDFIRHVRTGPRGVSLMPREEMFTLLKNDNFIIE